MPIKFGPAGLGPVNTAEKVLEEYCKLGFKACEIAFTYSVYIKPNEAEAIRKKAKEQEIELTIHAPYFLNLNSEDKSKKDATKKRILDCCRIGELLGVKLVVFHPGFYGKSTKEQAYQTIKQGVQEIMQEIKNNNWKIKIAPETMGKVNVFGSIEEIARLVSETGCDFCLDYAHILARNKSIDYEKIEQLFPQKNWHLHFSGINYTEKGEKNHMPTDEKELKKLIQNLPKNKEITLINESPEMIEDSILGLKIKKSLCFV